MPIKDALGRDIEVDYSEDIANLREVLDAAKARFKIFSDSLDIQKLTLEQITNIHACEKDAETAIKWVESKSEFIWMKMHFSVLSNDYHDKVERSSSLWSLLWKFDDFVIIFTLFMTCVLVE